MLKAKEKTERKVKVGRPRIPEETRDLVVRLYNEDMPIEKIAKSVQISQASIFRIIKERR